MLQDDLFSITAFKSCYQSLFKKKHRTKEIFSKTHISFSFLLNDLGLTADVILGFALEL